MVHGIWDIRRPSLPVTDTFAHDANPVTDIVSIRDLVCYDKAGDLQLRHTSADGIFHGNSVLCESRAVNGSSSISSAGRVASARIRATLCFCPPDRFPAFTFARV